MRRTPTMTSNVHHEADPMRQAEILALHARESGNDELAELIEFQINTLEGLDHDLAREIRSHGCLGVSLD